MKSFFLPIVAFAIGSQAHSATISTSNLATAPAESRLFYNTNGNSLAAGYAAFGYFSTLIDSDFATRNGLELAQDFNVLGSPENTFVYTDFGPTNTISGIIEFSAIADTTPPSDFIGKAAYLVVGNGATLATSTEAFIYFANITIAGDPSSPVNLDLSVANPQGSVKLGLANFTGDVFIGANNAGTITNGYQLVTLVPEPSTLLLSTIGVLGLLRRKR